MSIGIREGLIDLVFNHTRVKIKCHITKSPVLYFKTDSFHIERLTSIEKITLTEKIESESLYPQMNIKLQYSSRQAQMHSLD